MKYRLCVVPSAAAGPASSRDQRRDDAGCDSHATRTPACTAPCQCPVIASAEQGGFQAWYQFARSEATRHIVDRRRYARCRRAIGDCFAALAMTGETDRSHLTSVSSRSAAGRRSTMKPSSRSTAAVLAPRPQLLVDALARRGDEIAEVALRQLQVDAGAGGTRPAVILRQLQQHAREAHRQIEQRDLLQRHAGAAQLFAQHREQAQRQVLVLRAGTA